MSLFHHLPAELVREVLEELDPESFYLCLQTSKLFRQHAGTSTKLLRDHLSRIPGRRIISPHILGDANALIREFSKRAAQHLVAGVPWMVDRHSWLASSHSNKKISTLVRWGCDTEGNSIANLDTHPFHNHLVLIEVRSNDATVNVYIVEEYMQCGYCPRLKHIISPHSLSEHLPACGQHYVQYQVLKVASCMSDPSTDDPHNSDLMIAVLYQVQTPSCDMCSNASMKLLVFRLDAKFGPMVIESFEIEVERDEQVVAMAMTRSTEAIIVIRHGFNVHMVMVYRIEKDDTTLERHTSRETRLIIPSIQSPRECVSGISVQGDTVHLYPATFPMPHWILSPLSIVSDDISEAIERRDTLLPDVVDVFPKHSLGRAIAHHHHHLVTDPDLNEGAATCVNTALEFMISREESLTGSRTGAFLLKALHYPTSCKHFDLSKDYRRLHHVFVAQLAGLPDLHNLSTLGLRIAISPRSHRIAIASWKTVNVWSLDPEAFLNPDYSLGGAPGVPGDYAFTEGCGWQFYSSGKFHRECVVLEPVELPGSGVVFDLEFRNEDELWGWTSTGMCRWDFSVDACAKFDILYMEGVREEEGHKKR
ncbi:hypothetical protein K505DRAFT_364546 [Melanomma pulvis-pyrius CBS 109.77]|uniref:F-box domain-containing protein n=1 Tax=Melanomma pulvis-pyrius CBS 109.77 TaxID=1314802 RepID=A0A6A6X3E9_9PLEO|nr:hypothetical protein K505DRAFT_364546 [Melanomma pulvis-pyrius CBS 109.77]